MPANGVRKYALSFFYSLRPSLDHWNATIQYAFPFGHV
jgi:hypothetical protein